MRMILERQVPKALVVLLSGCAAAAVPGPTVESTFSLAPIDVQSTAANMVDHRTNPAPRDTAVLLPEGFFTPSIVDVLARRLATVDTLAGKEIEILECYTEMRTADGRPPLMHPSSIVGVTISDPSGVKIGPSIAGTVVGNVLARMILDELRAARHYATVFVFETNLRVRIDGREYSSIGVTQAQAKNHEFHARDSVDRAIKRLAERIRLE